jgi:uracil-DNA glycosylase
MTDRERDTARDMLRRAIVELRNVSIPDGPPPELMASTADKALRFVGAQPRVARPSEEGKAMNIMSMPDGLSTDLTASTVAEIPQADSLADKRVRLLELGRKRRASRWPPHKTIGDYDDGKEESVWVSPITELACNVNAEIMILMQDWSSDESMKKGGEEPWSADINLERLLKRHFRLAPSETFITNVFPFIKLGARSAPINMKDLVRAAKEFALPQVEIVAPKIAVCLGLATYNAVRRAAGIRPVTPLEVAIQSPFAFGPTRIWCQAHTGRLGTIGRNKGGVDRVNDDWARMAAAFFGPR